MTDSLSKWRKQADFRHVNNELSVLDFVRQQKRWSLRTFSSFPLSSGLVLLLTRALWSSLSSSPILWWLWDPLSASWLGISHGEPRAGGVGEGWRGTHLLHCRYAKMKPLSPVLRGTALMFP